MLFLPLNATVKAAEEKGAQEKTNVIGRAACV
jgi:hypothetical protein